jgi:outer membrane protein insertion porin family
LPATLLRRLALCLLLPWLALTLAPDAAAQQRPARAAASAPEGVVRAIEVRGNQRIEADTIRSYMLLQPGDAFDTERLDRSLRTLFATGLFRDVQVERAGSAVVVTVVENPIVNRVAFEGNRRISDDILRNETQLAPRAVFTPAAAQGDRQRLLEIYARRGRFAARIEPKVIELEQNRVDVVFEITEGDPALISRITFVGNRSFSEGRLGEVVSSREQAWWRVLSTADTFEPERLNFDRELLRRFYLRQGYADVQVTGATAELAPDRSGFFVTFTIDEGPRYRVGSVEVVSNLRNLEAAPLRRVVEIGEGDWYNGEAVERSAQALSDEVNLRGIPFVEVQPRITRDREAERINLVFEINEGPRAFVERIEITGNTRTQDRVIRREFRIAEGDAFNAALVRRSRQRIRDLGYFASSEITPVPGSGPERVVLNTQVQERATGELSIGGGFSTDAGVLADFGIRERNILGTGIDARANLTLAERRSQVDLSITDPQFLDRNLAAGADLFYVQRDLREIASYQERRTGLVLRAGYEFNERLRQAWAYSLVERDVFDVRTDASRFIRDQEGRTLLSQIGQVLTYDRRDSRLEPRSGYVVRLGTDFAGIGGDVAYFRGRLDATYFVPLESVFGDQDWVLAISAGGGVLEPLGGGSRDERIVDRFFLGGENLRGFRLGGAGPRDLATGDTLGGRVIWTQSTELRFPVGLPRELGVIGRTFVDVGSLSSVPGGTGVVDDSAPRVGVGFGISWRSPIGLINLDFAQAVVKESYDETQVFRFGFGTRF